MLNIILFIILYQSYVRSQLPIGEFNQLYQHNYKLYPNEKYLIYENIDTPKGDVELLHYSQNFRFKQYFMHYNNFRVIKIQCYLNEIVVLAEKENKPYIMIQQQYSKTYEIDLLTLNKYQNTFVIENQLIILSISQLNEEEFYQLQICDLQKCSNTNQIKQKKTQEEIFLSTSFLMFADISLWKITFYQYSVNEFQFESEFSFILDQQSLFQKYNTQIVQIISIKLIKDEAQEYLSLLTDENKIFHFQIAEQVLIYVEQINMNWRIISYNYISNNLIYIFEQDNQYKLQSDHLYQNVDLNLNLDEHSILLVFEHNKNYKIIIYNKQQIFQLNNSTIPLELPSEAEIYKDQNFLFTYKDSLITQVDLLNLNRISYIQYSKIGQYYIQLDRTNPNYTLQVDISEQFQYSIENLKQLVVVPSGQLQYYISIHIPGIKFTLLEDQANILKTPFSKNTQIYKFCYSQDSAILIDLLDPKFQFQTNEILQYYLIVQFKDGIYFLKCRNDQIVSQKPLFLFKNQTQNKPQQICVQDGELLILDEDQLNIISFDELKNQYFTNSLGNERYNLSQDCVLTNELEQRFKYFDEIFAEFQWMSIIIKKQTRIQFTCIWSLLYKFQEEYGQILQIVPLNSITILINYLYNGKQCLTKYYIQNCKLSQIHDISLYDFIFEIPMNIKICNNIFIIQASHLNQKYVLLYDWTYSQGECLLLVHKLNAQDKCTCNSNDLIIFNENIEVISIQLYSITFKESNDTIFKLKWKIESDYALFQQNEFIQTVILQSNKLSLFQQNPKLQMNSLTQSNYTLDVQNLFNGPIHNISSVGGTIISPLHHLKNIPYYQDQKIMHCCISVGSDIYYLIQSKLMKYTENKQYQFYDFDQDLYQRIVKLLYFEEENILMIILFNMISNSNSLYLIDLQLNFLKQVTLHNASATIQIYQYSNYIFFHMQNNNNQLYQLKGLELIEIRIKSHYNQIYQYKQFFIFYNFHGNELCVLFTEIQNSQVVDIESKTYQLSVYLEDFRNISVHIQAVRLYGNERIKIMLLTSQGIFLQNLGDNQSSVILDSQVKKYYIQNNILILIIQSMGMERLHADVYDISKENSFLTKIQVIGIYSQRFHNYALFSFHNNQLFMHLTGEPKQILVYNLTSVYELQINQFTDSVNLTAFNYQELMTTSIKIEYTFSKASQICISIGFVLVLSCFLEYQVRRQRKYQLI